jgi:hypothetical protein
MMKRKSDCLAFEHLKRQKYGCMKDGEVLQDVYMLPNSLLIILCEAIKNKQCVAVEQATIRKYRKTVQDAIDRWRRDQFVPREIAVKLFLRLSSVDLERLQIHSIVSSAINNSSDPDHNIPTSLSEASSDELFGEFIYGGHPLSTSFSAPLPSVVDELCAPSNDDEDYELDSRTGFFKERPKFKQVITEWGSAEFGVSRAALDRLLKRLHGQKPMLTDADYKKLPKSGKRLLHVKKRHRNILYRDFSNFDNDLDEFVSDDEENHENIESSDDSSDTDDDTPYDADDPGDSSDSSLEDEFENEEEEAYNYDKDVADFAREKNQLPKTDKQRMVYFGVENILAAKKATGLLHKTNYHNFLKSIAVLDNTSLTDKVIDRIFRSDSQVYCSIFFFFSIFLLSMNGLRFISTDETS